METKFEIKRIPDISDKELLRRSKIAIACGVVEDKQGMEMVIEVKNPNLKNAYLWDWKHGKALGYMDSNKRFIYVRDKKIDKEYYTIKHTADSLGEFITLHACAFYGFYKPSIKEILAQLPIEIFEFAKNKKLYYINQIFNDGGGILNNMLDQKYHIARTKVFIET